MVHPWSTAAVKSVGSCSWQRAYSRTVGSSNGCYVRRQSSQIKKRTSSVYGLQSTFPPDSALIRIYQNRRFSGGGRKKISFEPSAWKKERLEWRHSGRRERKLTDTLKQSNPCTNSSASVTKSTRWTECCLWYFWFEDFEVSLLPPSLNHLAKKSDSVCPEVSSPQRVLPAFWESNFIYFVSI